MAARALLCLFAFALAIFAQPTPFEDWLRQEAEKHWTSREAAIAAISNGAGVTKRGEASRAKMLELIGGLPSVKTPLRASVTGTVRRQGYRIENVIFESQPGFKVTANLYLPDGPGPFPAVLGTAGHSVNGKASATYQRAFIGFVRQGFAVLAYDPPGQGERWEYVDPDTGVSKIGAGVSEHNMAGLQALLIGQTMARFEIWDGIRAFDYLLTRREVDSSRIAVAGNSGGGTQAAYLAAFEPRLAAIVSSCYMTRWRELWSGPGPQDAEQIFPGFISSGLDFGDFLLAHAPKPYLMTTAIRDYFPIAGARATFRDAQRLFDLSGRGEQAGYFEFDDTHGWSQPRREAAVRWLARWLQKREVGGTETDAETEEDSVLAATSSGQLATSGGSETVHSLVKASAASLKRPAASREHLVRALDARPVESAVTEPAGAAVDGWLPLSIVSEGGLKLDASLFLPKEPRAAVVVAGSATGTDLESQEFANAGFAVLRVSPRGERESRGNGVGGYSRAYQVAARAMLLGRNLPEMQAADLMRARAVLAARVPGVAVRLYARGALGPAALFAAALDGGFASVAIERSIVSYQSVVESRIHRGLETAVVPGILKTIDLPDVAELLDRREAVWISPVTPAGAPMAAAAARAIQPRAAVVLRGEGWPLTRALPGWFASPAR